MLAGQSPCAVVHDTGYTWLPAGRIDLLLTDPPFNIARDTNFHTYADNAVHSFRFDADKGWDSHSPEAFRAMLGAWAAEFARVLRPGGSFAVFCADAYLSHLWDALAEVGLAPRRVLTWRKPNAVPVNRSVMMMSAVEYVVVGVKPRSGKSRKPVFQATLPLTDTLDLQEIERVLVAGKAADVVDAAVRTALDALPAGLSAAERG